MKPNMISDTTFKGVSSLQVHRSGFANFIFPLVFCRIFKAAEAALRSVQKQRQVSFTFANLLIIIPYLDSINAHLTKVKTLESCKLARSQGTHAWVGQCTVKDKCIYLAMRKLVYSVLVTEFTCFRNTHKSEKEKPFAKLPVCKMSRGAQPQTPP